jgi:mediator of RNA polymerase II transcription subunit 23
VEMTSLRLITGFNSIDVQTQLSRLISESKTLVSNDSEELNRALVLTIARAIHVTGIGIVHRSLIFVFSKFINSSLI